MAGGGNSYSNQPLTNQISGAYTGALNAAGNQQAYGQQALGAGAGAFGAASDAYKGALGYTPQDINAGQLGNTNLQPYMNPFQQNVIDSTMSELNRQETMGRMAAADAATKANTFGGMRHGIAEAENARNFRDQRQNILSQLNSNNFLNAQTRAAEDINRSMQAAQANQGMRQNMYGSGASGMAGLANNAMGFGAQMYNPQSLANLSEQGFGMYNQMMQNALQAGTLQQEQSQAIIDSAKNQWEQFVNQPLRGLSAITGATVMPGGSTTTTKGGSSGGKGGAGGIMSGIGGMLGMFSDRNAKTDIEPLGKDPKTGQKMYAYRYKSDPKTYPKVVGPMAQDMPKGRTRKVGGKLVITS
jgi:hypothetical protein